MRSIAIVGAGYAGMLTAHALLQKGYRVAVFSDTSPHDFLTVTRPTGIAGRFNTTLAYERELGLNHWDDQVPWVDYAHVTLSPQQNNRLLTVCGRLERPGCSVDLRLQCARWLTECEAKGARVSIESVSIDRLEQIARDHDLTIVAAGKGEMRKLFERDEEKSTHVIPPRKIVAVAVSGNKMGFEGAPGLPVRFNIFPDYGECFWVPWLHRDKGPGWALSVEAKPGSPLDRFDGVKSGEELLTIMKQLIKDFMPWDYEWTKNAELTDEYSWIAGSFVPEVRRPFGVLPSGTLVMSLGDTAISHDPVAAQGANTGSKMVRNLIECIDHHKEKPFTKEWMINTFEKFWARHHWTCEFTDVLLNPMTKAGQELLIAAYGSTGRADDASGPQKVADAFANNFDDPARITNAFYDMREARKLIESKTGRSWLFTAIKNRLKIGKGQLLQKLGKDPGHPSTVSYKKA
jgi:hypothetical protein